MNKYKNIKYSIFTLTILTIIGCGISPVNNTQNKKEDISFNLPESSEYIENLNINSDSEIKEKVTNYLSKIDDANNIKIDTNGIEDYIIVTFTRFDTDGNSYDVIRKINKTWDTDPIIIVKDNGSVIAVDREDGEINKNLKIRQVKTEIDNQYKFYYTVEDSKGHKSSLEEIKNYTAKPQIIGTSCKDILDNGNSSGDGIYTIDPDGKNNGEPPFEIYCDMTTDGGGWSLITSGRIDKNTLDSEFVNYVNEENMIFKDMNKLYHTNINGHYNINFTEWKYEYIGNTNQYFNHVKLDREMNVKNGTRNPEVQANIIEYNVHNTMSETNTDYQLTNCFFGTNYNGLISCDEGAETQNPWYQLFKILKTSTGYGIHTCTRFSFPNGQNSINDCSEKKISAELYEGSCLGSYSWQNSITDPNCDYRNPNKDNYMDFKVWIK